MASTFVSKSRRVRFELTLRIIDLNNVPLVSGTSFVKWHLPSSTAAEHRGKTPKCAIKDHRVHYGYEKKTQVRIVVGKDQMLHECRIELECLQEYSAGGRGERLVLGYVHLNLAEYIDAADPNSPGAGTAAGAASSSDANEGITRRYLMQDSKINSTLKIGISMRHVDGTRDYWAPALKTAPVFGGIAGIISSSEPAATSQGGGASHGAANDHQNPNTSQPDVSIPNSFGATNKEIGEMQDMYRRTLAAFWASQPGELKADECIEDIFAGGDGWGKGGRPSTSSGLDGDESLQHGDGSPAQVDHDLSSSREGSQTSMARDNVGHMHNFTRHAKSRLRKMPGELDEMDVREDLVSWHIGKQAFA